MLIKKLYLLLGFLSFLLMTCGQVQAQTVTFPYFCGFEDTAENSQWQFVNGTNPNKWTIGSAVHNGGANGLYISPDNGATAAHTADKGFVSVYRTFTLNFLNTYQISFDWKAPPKGGGRMYVCWMPDAGADQPTTGASDAVPNWMIELYAQPWVTGDTVMTQASSWQYASLQVTGTGQPYKLVFLWVSGASSGIATGGCIDNIQIGKATCPKPTGLLYTEAGGGQGTFTWNGTAASYDLEYRDAASPNNWISITGTNSTSVTIPELISGKYVVRVRSICGNDTSIWAIFPNLLVYQTGCIKYLDLHASNVTATYGTFDNPFASTGVVDNGYASMSSQHTVNYEPGETDPRTGNRLKLIPDGEIASVRLGNWGIGAQAESITYEYMVDSTTPLLLLKYAVVLEEPGHVEANQPRFQLDILNQYGQDISASCGKEDFTAGYNTSDWNVIGGVTWKDWTTMGLDLQSYIGQTVKIRLTTKDCKQEGHYGYAYFALGCASASISGLTCSETVEAISAPDGFNYEWYKKGNENNPDSIVSTNQSFSPAVNDTATYVCKMVYKGKTSCSFSLEASLAPRFISPLFRAATTFEDCRAVVSFDNGTYTYTRKGDIGEADSFYWEFGNGETSTEKNPTVIYDTPGTYIVSLTAGIANDECLEAYTDTIYIPDFAPSNDTIRADIIAGTWYEFDGVLYSEPDTYINRYKSTIGCDSIRTLILSVYDKYEIHLTDTICNDENYDFNGILLVESGIYTDSLKSVAGADSIIILNLTVLPVLEVELGELPEICGNDLYFDIPYTIHSGSSSGYAVLFDEKALHAGFSDITGADEIRVNLPDKIRPDIYKAELMFHDSQCDNDSLFQLEFMVKYPSWVLEQKWNDVIALLNSKYNGGYEFTTYQWYLNGEPVTGQNGSYIYLPQLLDTTAYYSMKLTRADDGVAVFSCAIVPELRAGSDISVYPRLVSPGESIQVLLPAKGKAAVWNTMGLKMGEHTLEGFSNAIEMPDRKGVYILDIATDEGQRKTFQVIVK